MRKKLIIPVLAIVLIVGLCASTLAGGHGPKAPKKVGILQGNDSPESLFLTPALGPWRIADGEVFIFNLN